MRLIELLKSSFTTLKANKRRTYLTMIGIVIGISSVITILSMGRGFEKYSMETLTDDEDGRVSQWIIFFENPEIDPENIKAFNASDFELVQEVEGVESAELAEFTSDEAIKTTVPVSKNGKMEHFNVGVNQQLTQENIVAGRMLSSVDDTNNARVTLITEDVAHTLFDSAENAIGQSLDLKGELFVIVGVYQIPKQNNQDAVTFGMGEIQLSIPFNSYQLYIDSQKSFNEYLKVFIAEGAEPRITGENVLQKLQEEGAGREQGEYHFRDMSEQMKAIEQTLQSATLFITLIAAISLFIAGVGVMNMMYISVSERTKEIAIRRSIGATQKSIQWQFLLEGIAITFIGGIIGYLIGLLNSFSISHFLPFRSVFDLSTALISVLISILIGVIFSVMPARSAAKKNLIDILR